MSQEPQTQTGATMRPSDNAAAGDTAIAMPAGERVIQPSEELKQEVRSRPPTDFLPHNGTTPPPAPAQQPPLTPAVPAAEQAPAATPATPQPSHPSPEQTPAPAAPTPTEPTQPVGSEPTAQPQPIVPASPPTQAAQKPPASGTKKLLIGVALGLVALGAIFAAFVALS